VIGQVLRDLINRGICARDEVVIATKGGFVDKRTRLAGLPDVLARHLSRETQEVLRRDGHCIAPDFLKQQLRLSQERLGVHTIDIYFLHNPERLLRSRSRREFLSCLAKAFAYLETAATAGLIGGFGVAAWQGFCRRPDSPQALWIRELLSVARAVGGQQHHFCVIETPYNVVAPDARLAENQPNAVGLTSTIAAAAEAGLAVLASASLADGVLADYVSRGLPISAGSTAAQAALQFVRCTPGVTSAIVNMRRIEHVKENISVLGLDRADLPERDLQYCSAPDQSARITIDEIPALLAGSRFRGTYREWRESREIYNKYIRAGDRVLDVGCANGFLLRSLLKWRARQEFVPFGFDWDISLIREARRIFDAHERHFWVMNYSGGWQTAPMDVVIAPWKPDHEYVQNCRNSGSLVVFSLYDDDIAIDNALMREPHELGLPVREVFCIHDTIVVAVIEGTRRP
jgi:aryl-alcohol dehydrogenase-like predicted oxidoreductase